MHIAILTVASLSLVCSAGTLIIMAKTAQELKTTKHKVEEDIQIVRTKVARNAAVVKTALSELEL